MSKTLSRSKREIVFLDEITIAKFSLTIKELDESLLESVAIRIKDFIKAQLDSKFHRLASLYDIEVFEPEIWKGSRKSKVEIKGKKKKGGTLRQRLNRLKNQLIIGIGLMSTDPEQVKQNAEWIIKQVEIVFTTKDTNVKVDDIIIFPNNEFGINDPDGTPKG